MHRYSKLCKVEFSCNGQNIWTDTFSYIKIVRCPALLKFFLKIGNKSRRFYERLLCDITLSWYYTIRRTYKYGRNVFLFKKIEWAEIWRTYIVQISLLFFPLKLLFAKNRNTSYSFCKETMVSYISRATLCVSGLTSYLDYLKRIIQR